MRPFLLAVAVVSLGATGGAAAPAKKAPFEKAVDKGLEFLANTQDKRDGSWTAGLRGKSPAITSLAVLAFLSAGHVPGEGRHGASLERAVRWVVKQQRPNGLLASDGSHEMYHHGICTLMLAEVAGMTAGPPPKAGGGKAGKDDLNAAVRQALVRAVQVILSAQRTRGLHKGGWHYTARDTGGGADISLTGWQVMALRAAKNLGCDVPAEKIEWAVAYIKRCRDPGSGGFQYRADRPGLTIPCTGTSVLALEICGKDLHHSPETLGGGNVLIRAGYLPRWGGQFFYYGIYYGAQATFQLGGNYWDTYRPHLHQLLVRHQGANGAWQGSGLEWSYGGPNYCTAMAVLALTVEYRFLPIYQRAEGPAGKK
jgi:hypothetical protein